MTPTDRVEREGREFASPWPVSLAFDFCPLPFALARNGSDLKPLAGLVVTRRG